MLKKIFGALIMVAGTALALYLGGWLLVVKPIIDIYQLMTVSTATVLQVIMTAVEVWFGLLLGFGIFVLGADIGAYLFWEEDEDD